MVASCPIVDCDPPVRGNSMMQPSLERHVDVFKLVVIRKDVVQVVSSVRAAGTELAGVLPLLHHQNMTYRLVMYISISSGGTSSETVFSTSTPSTSGPSAKLT